MHLSTLTDEALALRARREPRAAFEIFFERYQRPVYNFLLRQGVAGERSKVSFVLILYEGTPREERREESFILEKRGEQKFVRDVVFEP